MLISIFAHCLSSYHWVWIVRSSFKCPLGYLSLLIWSPWAFSNLYWTVPDLSVSPCDKSLTYLCGFCWTCSTVHMGFVVLLTPALDSTLQMCLTSAQKKGRITLPDLPGIIFLMQSRSSLVFSVVCPQVLFCKVPFQLVRPDCTIVLFLPWWETWCFSF